jgi:hypothetical protein
VSVTVARATGIQEAIFTGYRDVRYPRHHMVVAVRVAGPFDYDQLVASVGRAAAMHPGMRTTLVADAGGCWQRTGSEAAVEVLPSATVASVEVVDRMRAAAAARFDLQRYTMRVGHWVVDDGGQYLLLAFHHVMWDFEAMDILIQDLARLAGGEDLVEGHDPSPGTLAEAEEALGEGPTLIRLLDAWQERIAELPLPIDLVEPARRRPRQSTMAQTYEDECPSDLAAQVAELEARTGVGRVGLVLAALGLVLAARNRVGERGLPVGLAVSRRGPDTGRAIGNFTVPVPIAIGGLGDTFVGLAHRTQRDVLRSLSLARVSLPTVVNELAVPAVPGRHPLFDVLIGYNRFRGRSAADRERASLLSGRGSATVGRAVWHSVAGLAFAQSGTELLVTLTDDGTTIWVAWEHDPELIDGGQVRRWHADLLRILRRGCESPGTSAAELAPRRAAWDGPRVNGYPVDTGLVAGTLRAVPGVADAVVSVVQGRVVADVDGEHSEALTGRIIQAARERHPGYLVPSTLYRVARPAGKSDRERAAERVELRAGTSTAARALETEVASVWSGVLGVPVDPEDRFFDVGGHSLKAATISSVLTEAAAVRVGMADLLANPNVRELCQMMMERKAVRER